MRLISRLTHWLGTCLLLALLCACNGEPNGEGPVPASTSERDARLNQSILQMQAQIANLENQIEEMKTDQTRQLNHVTDMGRALNAQLAQMRQTLSGPPPAAGPAATPLAVTEGAADTIPAAPVDEVDADGEPGNAILRLILVVILLGVIFFMVRVFMGRWGEDDEEEEEEEEDFEYNNEEGKVRLSPEVQAEARQFEESESEARPDQSPPPGGPAEPPR